MTLLKDSINANKQNKILIEATRDNINELSEYIDNMRKKVYEIIQMQ